MISIEPSPLDTSRVGKPGHILRVLVALDEWREIATVLEQQRGVRRRLPDMRARHGAEELDAGDALDRWEGGGKGVDQADRHVVAIDVVPLDAGLAARSRHDRGRFAIRI